MEAEGAPLAPPLPALSRGEGRGEGQPRAPTDQMLRTSRCPSPHPSPRQKRGEGAQDRRTVQNNMTETEKAERAHLLAVAHTWLGTPFHDGGRVKGVGTDCGCLLAEVFAEAGLVARVDIKPYSPQFFMHRDEPIMLGIVATFAREIDEAAVHPADMVLYKFARQFSHAAIIIEPGWPSILHAYKQSRAVVLGEGNGGDLEGRERRFFRLRTWCSK